MSIKDLSSENSLKKQGTQAVPFTADYEHPGSDRFQKHPQGSFPVLTSEGKKASMFTKGVPGTEQVQSPPELLQRGGKAGPRTAVLITEPTPALATG